MASRVPTSQQNVIASTASGEVRRIIQEYCGMELKRLGLTWQSDRVIRWMRAVTELDQPIRADLSSKMLLTLLEKLEQEPTPTIEENR